jgi:hypothetical protein
MIIRNATSAGDRVWRVQFNGVLQPNLGMSVFTQDRYGCSIYVSSEHIGRAQKRLLGLQSIFETEALVGRPIQEVGYNTLSSRCRTRLRLVLYSVARILLTSAEDECTLSISSPYHSHFNSISGQYPKLLS